MSLEQHEHTATAARGDTRGCAFGRHIHIDDLHWYAFVDNIQHYGSANRVVHEIADVMVAIVTH